jgi:hypothetical protein
VDNVLKGRKVVYAAPQYIRLKACFAVQGDKAALDRAFRAEALFHDADARIGNDPDPG